MHFDVIITDRRNKTRRTGLPLAERVKRNQTHHILLPFRPLLLSEILVESAPDFCHYTERMKNVNIGFNLLETENGERKRERG